MEFASITLGNYKIELNEKNNVFNIIDLRTNKVKISCTTPNAAMSIVDALNKDDEILAEVNRLNNIKEPERSPANRSSLLYEPIAKKTRELLGKEK